MAPLGTFSSGVLSERVAGSFERDYWVGNTLPEARLTAPHVRRKATDFHRPSFDENTTAFGSFAVRLEKC